MRKNLIAILVLCLMFTTFLTACTAPTDNSSSVLKASSANSSTASKANSSVTASAETSAALADYAKKQNDIVGMANSDAMKITCTARGTSLLYTYTYGIDLDKATAQKSLDALDATYSSTLSLVQLTVKECTSIVIEFKGKNGSVIASKEYK